ncbi:MAG: cation transporter [Bacteroidales bacterium]|nr:cation transporter [Bacteroidales bacterium]
MMKRALLLLTLVLAIFTASAQQKAVQTVTIQTNGTCEQCKKLMMDNVPQWKGVQECTYDMKTAKLTIKYDSSKTSVDQLRAGVSKLGYDADNVKADAAARAKLPSCCTKPKSEGGGCSGGCGGCGHHH